MKFQSTLQNRGKLYLPPRCKSYSKVLCFSTITQNNSKEDILPLVTVDLDCCLTEVERDELQKIPLQKPLNNIISSVDELKIAGVKISEIQELINKEQAKKAEHFRILTSTYGSILLILFINYCMYYMLFLCCCKFCRQ